VWELQQSGVADVEAQFPKELVQTVKLNILEYQGRKFFPGLSLD